MKNIIIYTCLLLVLFPYSSFCQTAEKQISFARESKPHIYYVQQAELWWKEVQKDNLSENNWFNYFRACRNAHGTADWRSDFINESPYLKTGDSIIYLMQKYIPNTFTYYYLSYLSNGIGTDNGQNLLKAYQMNPDFEGIHSSVVSYAVSNLDTTLRKKVNKAWFKTNYLSPQLLNYAYNVLMSIDKNAILFTQQDNDTYPLWMLQDALGIRTDVKVINIDFLLIDSYRKKLYEDLAVPELDLGIVNLDEYHSNWKKVLQHVLENYSSHHPVYVGMTIAGELYKDYEKQMYVSGLTFKFSKTSIKTDQLNKSLYESMFMLDYLHQSFLHDQNQTNIDYQNLNYLNCFENIYNQYKAEKKTNEAKKLKELCILLVKRIGNAEYLDMVEKKFK